MTFETFEREHAEEASRTSIVGLARYANGSNCGPNDNRLLLDCDEAVIQIM